MNCTTHPLLTNWLPATVIALLLASSFHLDGPADYEAEQAQAVSLMDAQRTEAAAQRHAQAVQALCGPNAGVIEQADGSVRCTLKNGRKANTVRSDSTVLASTNVKTKVQP